MTRRLSHAERAAVVLAGAGLAVFVALAVAVSAGWTQGLDEWVLRGLRRPGESGRTVLPGPLELTVRQVTALGSWLVLMLLAFGAFGGLLLARRRGLAWLVMLASAGGWSLERVIKLLVGRPRPGVVPHLEAVGSPSFPSGHAMLSVVVYLAIALAACGLIGRRGLRVYAVAIASGLAGLVGSTRVVLGVHYPTDVLAGWGAGLAWVLACWLVCRVIEQWARGQRR